MRYCRGRGLGRQIKYNVDQITKKSFQEPEQGIPIPATGDWAFRLFLTGSADLGKEKPVIIFEFKYKADSSDSIKKAKAARKKFRTGLEKFINGKITTLQDLKKYLP